MQHPNRSIIRRSPASIALAVTTSAIALALGYVAFGFITSCVFAGGFLGGLVLWLVVPAHGSWQSFRHAYWVALALFLVHRIEEKVFGFFAVLERLTGVSTPPATSTPVLLLVAISVGGWLLVPILMKREHPFGHYLAWTFLASMGITELAHFVVFPFLDGPGYGYIPGMASVILLAPVAWYGMWRLARPTPTACATPLHGKTTSP